jgi:hypothetical protein
MWLQAWLQQTILGRKGGSMATNEAFSRTIIDAQLGDAGWKISDSVSVHFEYPLSDGTKADYLLCDRNGRRRWWRQSAADALLPQAFTTA